MSALDQATPSLRTAYTPLHNLASIPTRTWSKMKVFLRRGCVKKREQVKKLQDSGWSWSPIDAKKPIVSGHSNVSFGWNQNCGLSRIDIVAVIVLLTLLTAYIPHAIMDNAVGQRKNCHVLSESFHALGTAQANQVFFTSRICQLIADVPLKAKALIYRSAVGRGHSKPLWSAIKG